MSASEWLLVVAVVIFTLIAMVSDVRTRRLPNWLTVPAFVGGLVFHLVTGGLGGLGTAALGFAVGFSALLVLWLIGGGGGGDVKLMGALGAWLGPVPILIVLALSATFALLGTVSMAAWDLCNQGFGYMRRRYLSSTSVHSKGARSQEEVVKRRQTRRFLPYALPVALGTWLFLAWKIFMGTPA